ncbi:MAG: hypothetical protein QUU85_14475, partial [Candidatus Eisenbacteria bacterium]|nr:hypothetical protein [Candidatus Eisenbacteria bacterium]
MRIDSAARARANVCVETVDAPSGRLLRRSRRHNLVVDTGLALLRDIVAGEAPTLSHGAVGTDGTAVAAANVALGVEVFRDLISQVTPQGGGSTPYGLVIKFVVGSQFANGNTLREAGPVSYTHLRAHETA